MKIVEFLKGLFSKRSNVSYLVRLRDTINIRTRTELNRTDVLLLDKLKSEYLDLLKNKILFSKDLDIEELNKEMTMNMELVNNLFLRDEVDLFNYIDENEKLNSVIKARKLLVYLNHILEMKNEVELRIIALEEILEEKTFLSPIKTNAIINKCENLVNSYHVFKSQGEAIGLDISSLIDSSNYSSEEISKEDLEFKKSQVLECIKFAYLDKYQEYVGMEFQNDYERLAYLERELEIYVYNNKAMMGDEYYLKSFINHLKLIRVVDSNFYKLEMLFKIFSLYGRNLVDKELVEKLYSYKFNVITQNMYDNYNENAFKKLTYAEMECYDKIISEKIENILMGDNRCLLNIFGPRNYNLQIGINFISGILKGKEGIYSSYNILNDKKLLLFLCSFDGFDCLKRFFYNYMVNCSDYDFPSSFIFKWEKQVPIITICELIECGYLKSSDKLYSFYNLIKDIFKSSYNYLLLKGLKEIGSKYSYLDSDSDMILMDEIYKKSKDKDVYMPESFVKMRWSYDLNCNFLYINDGAQSICYLNIDNNKKVDISIPPSLEKIRFNLNVSNLGNIIFRDYKNSKILNNFESFSHFCTDLFYVRAYTNNDKHYKPLIEKKNFKYVYELVPCFSEIILEYGDIEITICSDDFKFIICRNDDMITTDYRKHLSEEETVKIMHYISYIIKEEELKQNKRKLSKD